LVTEGLDGRHKIRSSLVQLFTDVSVLTRRISSWVSR
jgi:hypothetical protein